MGAFALLRTRSLREGLVKGRRGWFAVGVVVWSIRGLRLLARRQSQVVSVEKIAEGQSVLIRTTAPSRRRRP